MRARLAAIASGVLVAAMLANAPARADVAASVEIHSDYYKAAKVVIEPGQTVRWTAVDGGHTVTADNGDFDFPADAASGAVVTPGDVFEASFPEKGVFFYHCRIHGGAGEYPHGMTGVVYVGVDPDQGGAEVRHVPAEYPTIKAAMSGIAPGSTVSVAPGIYDEAVALTVTDITLQGEGADPEDVVIRGDGLAAASSIEASANGPVIRNLSVVGAPGAQTLALGLVNDFAVEDVVVRGGDTGVRVGGATGGSLRRVRSEGAGDLGVAVVGCSPCGIIVEDVVSSGAQKGLLVVGASGVVVRRFSAVDDATGVLIRDSQGIDVTQSTFRGGTIGIDVDSVDVPPTLDVRVFSNTVTGYSDVGLRWDLIGLHACFSGNVDPAAVGGQPTTSPPLLQTLFPCS